MGSLVFGIIGAGIGFVIGGGPAGAWKGFMIGSAIGGAVFGNRGSSITQSIVNKNEAPRIDQIKVQYSTNGQPIPKVWGSMRVAGGIIYLSEVREVKETKVIQTGSTTITVKSGKGGKKKSTQTQDIFSEVTTYSYFVDVAIGLCEGPIIGIRTIWADKALVYNRASDASMSTFIASATKWGDLRVYTGTETQTADSLLVELESAATMPAFRGLAYAMFDNLEISVYGNRLPLFEFEVVTGSASTSFSKTLELEHDPRGGFQAGTIYPDLVQHGHLSGTGSLSYYEFKRAFVPGLITWGGDDESIPFQGPDKTGVTRSSATVITGTAADIKTSTYWLPKDKTYWIDANTTASSLSPDMEAAESPASSLGRPGVFRFTQEGSFHLWWNVEPFSTYFPECFMFWDFEKNRQYVFEKPDGVTQSINYLGGVTKSLDYVYAIVIVTGVETQYWFWDTTKASGSRCKAIKLGENDQTGTGRVIRWINSNPYCWWAVYSQTAPGFPQQRYLERYNHGSYTPQKTINLATITKDPSSGYDVAVSEITGCWQISRSGDVYLLGEYDQVSLIDPSLTKQLGGVTNRSFLIQVPGAYGYGVFVQPWSGINSVGYESYWTDYYRIDDFGSLTTPTLDTIISDICADSGLAAGDIDVTDGALAAISPGGYARARPTSGLALLQQLGEVYDVLAAENAGKLTFRKRTATLDHTIAQGNSPVVESGNVFKKDVRETRQNEVQLPQTVKIRYIANRNYAFDAKEQSVSFDAVASIVNIKQLDAPINLTGDQARSIARRILQTDWRTQVVVQFDLPMRYIDILPGDVVQLTDSAGDVWRVLIDGMELFFPSYITFTGILWDAGALDVITTEVSNEGPQASLELDVVIPSFGELLNIPMLRNVDNDAGFYVVLGPLATGGWTNAFLLEAINRDGKFEAIASVQAAGGYGKATTILADSGIFHTWDRTSTVDVQMNNVTLTSSTELDVMNGENIAVIGDEIVQFVDVTDNGGGSYTLSTLLRGRRNTERFMDDHAVDERVIIIDTDTTRRVSRQVTSIGVTGDYKAVSMDQAESDVDTFSFENLGTALVPFAPAHLNGIKESNGDWTITWMPSTRFIDDGLSNAELSDAESYEVWIMDQTDPQNPVRVRVIHLIQERNATTGRATYTYLQADQSTDFGSPITTLDVEVYMKSEVAQIALGNAAIGTFTA